MIRVIKSISANAITWITYLAFLVLAVHPSKQISVDLRSRVHC